MKSHPGTSQLGSHVNAALSEVTHLSISDKKPSVTSSKDSPIEGTDSVTLTCVYLTSGTTYEWFKDNTKINGASARTYALPDNKRANSGSYKCKVTPQNVPAMESDAKVVTFLCKYG